VRPAVTQRKSLLPFPAKVLLWLFLADEDYDQALGDFEENYRARIAGEGAVRARAGLWFSLLQSLPMFAWDSIYWRGVMIKENLKIGWRVIKKQKLYSFLNITGLGVSLACLLMILYHVKSELGYESGFPKADRIYRVQTDSQYGSITRQWAASAPAMGPELEKYFPEIETTARLMPVSTQILVYRPVQGPPRRFEERRGFLAETSALSIFDLEFIKGNPETALQAPATAVLTSSFARKYFGGEDPIGKTLINETRNRPLLVTGVIRDVPRNTHIAFDYLISMPTFVPWTGYPPEILEHRTWKGMYTYVLLRRGQTLERFEAQKASFMKAFHAERPTRIESVRLQPIRRIHLYSKLEGEIAPNSDIAYVFVFSGAAFLILFIAVVNFVNLATAQSFKRSKEIGIRKVVGARRGQLVRQHLGEAALLTGISAVLGLLILNFFLPFYGRLAGTDVSLRNVLTPTHAGFLFLLLAVLSILAGLYPAFFASGFSPIAAIGKARNPRASAVLLRKGLVVFQFVISIFLIFSTITMSRQLTYFHRAGLGFNKENLIAVNLCGDFRETALRESRTLKEEIRRHSGVTGVALTSSLFGTPFSNERLTPVGTPDKNVLPMLRFIRVDEDFIRTAGLTVVRGRDFDAGSDQKSAYIISESTAAILGLDEPLGTECLSDVHEGQAPIVGVIKDFHFASLHSPIEPLVLEYRPDWTGYLLVQARADRVPDVLEFLKTKILELNPDFLFAFRFVDEVFEGNYAAEERSYDIFKIFSAVALFVACLGLFGLAVYAAENRVKEIGIRKILGASVPSICLLMSGSFLRWVLAANAIALPASYLAMRTWLRNFAFHTNIPVWTFVLAGLVVLFFALTTVGYQTLKSARENPVESLRYE
jgi:putative ABC transport system permease protein